MAPMVDYEASANSCRVENVESVSQLYVNFSRLRIDSLITLFPIAQTAYTKAHPTKPDAFVCFDCCTVLGIDPFAKTKKPAAKRAPGKGKKKEESRKVVSYEQRKGAINLAELCIKVSDFANLVGMLVTELPLCR